MSSATSESQPSRGVAVPSAGASPGKAAAPEDDFDLAKLCSVFANLESSVSTVATTSPAKASNSSPSKDGGSSSSSAANPGVERPVQAVQTPPTASASTSRALSGCSTPTNTTASVGRGIASQVNLGLGSWPAGAAPGALPNYGGLSISGNLMRSTSGGSREDVLQFASRSPTGSVGSTALAAQPVADFTPSEAVAGRMRDAQRMDAWFHRHLAKGTVSAGSGAPFAATSSSAVPAVAAASAAEEESARSEDVQSPCQGATPSCSLEVELSGEALGMLRWSKGDNIDAVCKAFVMDHRLKEIFRQPLVSHVELMVHMDKRADKVDVIDLI